ncbi:MAG: Fe2+-dependent dioxygenase [bacterium]
MIIRLPKLLTEDELQQLRSLVEKSRFVDGGSTAGHFVSNIKKNLEMQQSPEVGQQTYHMVARALNRSESFIKFARPKVYAPPLLSCYQPGMAYGEHVDEAIVPSGGAPMRTDVSVTVFLNDPGTYEGGELELQTPFGEQRIKLNAGDAVSYSTTLLHRVTEVKSGQRLALVTWAQSLVPDAAQREILADLQTAMSDAKEGTSRQLLFKSFTNLMKMWGEV